MAAVNGAPIADSFLSKALRRFAPVCLLVMLVLLVGIGIWGKAREAVAPPIYDAIEYYMKAGNVWSALHRRELVNPFDVMPTFRPPGTILISYPLGFSAEFHGFLFRAAFIPIALFVLAFWSVAESLVVHPADRWLNLGAASALAALPLFYQFEYDPDITSPGWWGLMDASVASLAALATALLLVSTRSRSTATALAGGALAAFTPLVKPVGLLLIPIVLWHWAVELVATHRRPSGAWRADRGLRRYLMITCAALAPMIAAVVAISFDTAYLSPENRRFASDAIHLVRHNQYGTILQTLLRGIHPTVGWHGLVVFLLASSIGLRGSIARSMSRAATANDIRLLGAFAALAGELAWWLCFPGVLFRYLFPFLLIFLVVTVPHAAAASRRFPVEARRGLVVAAACPLLFDLVLLFQAHPSKTLQQLAGVNLSTGQYRAEVAQANAVSDAANALQERLIVYSTRSDPIAGVVQAAGIYRSYRDPDAKSFDLTVPLDWHVGWSIRRASLVASDYVLFRPSPSPALMRARLAQREIRRFDEQQALVEAWLTGASANEGVEPLGGDLMKLLRVVDRAKFDQAYGELIAEHRWRDGLLASNAERRFYTPAELPRLIPENRVNAEPVGFGSKFILHAAAFERTSTGLQLRLTWQSLARQALKREVFVHLVNDSGDILAQANYPQNVAGRTATEGQVWKDTVDLPAAKLAGATRIGIGLIAHPAEVFLSPDSGRRDWQDRRLLLPLPGHAATAGERP